MQTARIERTILSNLMNNEDYARNVLPFLQSDYFHDGSEKLVFKTITDAFDKYNKPPTSEQLIITLTKHTMYQNQNSNHLSRLLIV